MADATQAVVEIVSPTSVLVVEIDRGQEAAEIVAAPIATIVEVITPGPSGGPGQKGDQGEQGPPGTSENPTYTTSAAVSGHRALMFDTAGDVLHADPSSPFALAGISSGAAATGASVSVVAAGAMSEVTWAWTPGLPVFVGAGGVLTQAIPSSGILQQIATAIGPTRIFVAPLEQTLLA